MPLLDTKPHRARFFSVSSLALLRERPLALPSLSFSALSTAVPFSAGDPPPRICYSAAVPLPHLSMTIMNPSPLDREDDEMLVPHSELTDGAQPMEVAPVDTATTAESQQQQVEDPPMNSRFTWVIEHFSRLHPKKHYSDVFMVGGYKWRVLIFPKGNNVDHLSMYLDVADSVNLPYGWSRYAQFSLAVVNQMHSKYSVRKGIIFAGIKVDFN